jgi:hypothetical protein
VSTNFAHMPHLCGVPARLGLDRRHLEDEDGEHVTSVVWRALDNYQPAQPTGIGVLTASAMLAGRVTAGRVGFRADVGPIIRVKS